jgi:hypothetical protein
MFLPQGFVFVYFVEDGLSPVLFYMSLKNKPPGTAFRIQPEIPPDCFSCFRSIKIKRFDYRFFFEAPSSGSKMFSRCYFTKRWATKHNEIICFFMKHLWVIK